MQIDMANRMYTVVHAATSMRSNDDRGANGELVEPICELGGDMLHAKLMSQVSAQNVLKDFHPL
jgi:hypothetical protein